MVTYNVTNLSELNLSALDAISYHAAFPLPPEFIVTVQDSISLWQFAIIAFVFYFFILMLHEMGHWICLWLMGKNPVISFSKDGKRFYLATIPRELVGTVEDKQIVLISGIAAGFVGVFLAAMIHPYLWLMAIPYAVGLNSDIKQIAYNIKRSEEK